MKQKGPDWDNPNRAFFPVQNMPGADVRLSNLLCYLPAILLRLLAST